MKSISAIHPTITENVEDMLAKPAPQELIIGTPISQYTSYSAIFCPLHSNIGKEQHKKHLCNPSSYYRKYGEYTREMLAPYLDSESHSISISAMVNFFHNIISKA